MSSHGELIDRDKLLDAIYDLWSEYSASGWEYVGRDDVINAILDAEEVEDD